MLSVEELEYDYSVENPVIANVTFAVVAGEIVSIVGPVAARRHC
jgi:ABC-type cobalamin/Fe3+-siderophores transport system ATPase subunit